MNNVLIGGDGWVYYETIGGGQGGRPWADGMSGVHTAMTNTLDTPVEALERALPLRVRRYTLRGGSGGAGAYRGGDGIEREIEVLEPVDGVARSPSGARARRGVSPAGARARRARTGCFPRATSPRPAASPTSARSTSRPATSSASSRPAAEDGAARDVRASGRCVRLSALRTLTTSTCERATRAFVAEVSPGAGRGAPARAVTTSTARRRCRGALRWSRRGTWWARRRLPSAPRRSFPARRRRPSRASTTTASRSISSSWRIRASL